jgi:hypothetical protein
VVLLLLLLLLLLLRCCWCWCSAAVLLRRLICAFGGLKLVD